VCVCVCVRERERDFKNVIVVLFFACIVFIHFIFHFSVDLV
jgi:hypothetical protein